MKITKVASAAAAAALLAGCGGAPAHHATKAAAAIPIPTALVTCATVSPSLHKLLTDLQTSAGPAAYDQGVYTGSGQDLQNFLDKAAAVARTEPSRPRGLSAGIVRAELIGSSLSVDGTEPASKAAADMASFRTVMASLGRECFLLTESQAANVLIPPAPPKPKPKHHHHARQQTVTYIVSGSYAQVTYGPAGSSYSGSVPMDVTQPLGNPLYYSIDAQLQGGGSVSCAIQVNGKTISSATATGGYNIAMCEIVQDPLYGGWTDANSAG
jgi:hypothetical protein